MRNHKKFTILSALCLAITLLCAVCFVACDSHTQSTTSHTPKATTYVSVDVNPSIELVLDQNDEVMSATGANEDARILLFREDGIVGTKVNVAIENIASLAVEYGYLKEDNSTIDVCVASSSDDKQNTLFKSISDAFVKGARNENETLSVSIANGISLSLSTELAKLKSQYPSNKNIQALSVADFKLIKRTAEANPSLTYADLAGKNTEELIALSSILQNGTDAMYGDSYKKQVNKAKLVYNNTVQTLEGTFYIKHFATTALGAYLDKDYSSAMANLAKTSSAVKYTAANAYLLSLSYYQTSYANYFSNPTYTVSQDEIAEIAGELGVSTDEFEEGVGTTTAKDGVKISKSDLAFFVDRLYRNANTQQKAHIAIAYENICDRYFAIADKDDEDLQFSIDDVDKRILAIKASLASPQMTLMLSFAGFDIDNVLSQCKPQNVDYDDYSSIEKAISSLKESAQSAKDEMSLTEEDEAQVKEDFASVQSTLNDALQIFNKAKEEAVNDAVEYILSIKQSRKDGNN